MPVAHEFDYLKPETLDEAVKVFSTYGSKARVLAGGTDLALKLKEGTETPDMVIDLKGLVALKQIEFDGRQLMIGSLVTFSQIIASPEVREHFPLLRDATRTVGSVGIRNRATLAGNICSAVPSLDSGPALLVYEAQVLTKSVNGERTVPIQEWFVGPKRSALQPGEIVIGIVVPLPSRPAAGCYLKLGRYGGEDLAQAGVGILALDDNAYRVAFCAVGPIPKRSSRIEAVLHGQTLTDDVLEQVKTLVPEEISPITDIRASKEYRALMVKVMVERGLKIAEARLNGKHTENGAVLV